MYVILLSRLGWCSWLLTGIVIQATKTIIEESVFHLLFLLNPWLIVEMWPAYIFSICITLVHVPQNWLNWFHFLFLEGGLIVILIDCMIFL